MRLSFFLLTVFFAPLPTLFAAPDTVLVMTSAAVEQPALRLIADAVVKMTLNDSSGITFYPTDSTPPVSVPIQSLRKIVFSLGTPATPCNEQVGVASSRVDRLVKSAMPMVGSRGLLTFTFPVEIPGKLTVDVYSFDGRFVATLFAGTVSPGSTAVSWNRNSASGSRAACGLYYVRAVLGHTPFASRTFVVK